MTTTNLFRHAQEFESYPAGASIFSNGEPGKVMYVVKQGEVEIQVRDRVVETIGAGGIFGEMALIQDAARSASAVAKTDCQVVPINEKRFNFLLQQTPGFALQVMKVMAARLRRGDG